MFLTPWNTIHLKQGDAKPAADPEKIVIYAMRFCPYAERAILTSLEKGLDFAVVNINLTSKPDWFLEMNPSGSIPVVEYKGEVVAGSVEASMFIDKVGGKSLQPSKDMPEEKAKKIIKKSSEALDILYKIIGFGSENQTAKDRKQYIRDISDILAFFDYELGGAQEFYGGKTPNFVDLMIWPLFERLPILPILHPNEDLKIISRHRKIASWVENMMKTSSVMKYKLEPKELAKFYKVFAKNREHADYDFTINGIHTNSEYLKDIQ